MIPGMDVGLIGVGKIGTGILRRLRQHGLGVTAFDTNPATAADITAAGGQSTASVEELVSALPIPRMLWLMLPAGEPVASTIDRLAKLLDAGDTLIDGGNSYFKDSLRHGSKLEKRGINFLDIGVSGGVAGEKHGYALMIGGKNEDVGTLHPILTALAAPDGWAHVGPIGAGHYVKMVHNAVEYGMMQAIGEGFDLLKSGHFNDLDLPKVARLWSHGTIVRSFLMELAAAALEREASLASIAPHVEDSGEGRWAATTAVEHAVPFWVNTAALYARFDSRAPDSFAAKLVAALRKEFGGHKVKMTKPQ